MCIVKGVALPGSSPVPDGLYVLETLWIALTPGLFPASQQSRLGETESLFDAQKKVVKDHSEGGSELCSPFLCH